MAKKNLDEVKQLIDLGKEKGFLTYDEVNDILPPDIVSSEQIDDVMSMFGEMDIEIVDSVQKVKIPKAKLDLEEEEELEGEHEEVEFEPGTLGRTSDPVRMYLREMGSVSLLTREGEVETVLISSSTQVRGTPGAGVQSLQVGHSVVVLGEPESSSEQFRARSITILPPVPPPL